MRGAVRDRRRGQDRVDALISVCAELSHYDKFLYADTDLNLRMRGAVALLAIKEMYELP